jgi:hypothetical protein
MGMSAVLHTWGQNLYRHIHLHCLVPGGALDAQGNWRAAKGNYLFPVKALSRRFRGQLVSALRRAHKCGQLAVPARDVDALMGSEWVVYAKPYLTQVDTIVDYLARYSHQ